MNAAKLILEKVLDDAIAALRQRTERVCTVAFYYDHECNAVSICADTHENSERVTAKSCDFSREQFLDAISEADLESAARWSRNTGRSLSLGDFAFVNIAYTKLRCPATSPDLYIEMIRVLNAKQDELSAVADPRVPMLLAASGPKFEVEFSWVVAFRHESRNDK
jgi:hypothetical protein